MPTFSSLASAALPWQNFYVLTGEAAATLVGLMFVAVTFVAFGLHRALALDRLAIATLGTLLIGVYGAWEMLVWMAIVRSRPK